MMYGILLTKQDCVRLYIKHHICLKIYFFFTQISFVSPNLCTFAQKKYFVHKNQFCVKYLRKIFPKTLRCLLVEARAPEMRVRAGAWNFRCLHMSQHTAIYCTAVQCSQGSYTFSYKGE